MRRSAHRIAVLACLTFTACQDSTRITQPDATILLDASEGRGWFQRYVAIGTSVSQGWLSDGVLAAGQQASWPAQLARLAQREMSLPLISGFGCKAPFAAPLITFQRISGEPVNVTDAAAQRAPNEPGVSLPTQNLGISGATTGDALTRTPALQTNPLYGQLYARVLPPGETQVSAMEKQNPKFVSVELGANDILGVHSGVVIPGVSFVPFNVWAAQYNQVLDHVGAITKSAVLVGLGQDIAKLSSLRRGHELWADRTAFLAAFHVDVSVDCDGNTNLIVVPVLVPTAVGTGLVRRANGLSPFVLSCAAGTPTTPDRILSAAEEAAVNAQFGLMNAHIQSEANARGYAFFELEALYGLPKGPFSVVSLMTSATPYGSNISLDGLHPSPSGHAILAQAAMQAINARYNLGITTVAMGISSHR